MTLQILKDKKVPHQVRLYLTEPLDFQEWQYLLKLDGITWDNILRKKEASYPMVEHFIPNQEKAAIEVLIANPILLERPVIIAGKRGLVARSADDLTVWLNTHCLV